MTLGYLGTDPLESTVETALRQIAAGESTETLERTRIDLKEEPGRRGSSGSILPGEPRNEKAASFLAGEMACMANTPGGGAIVVGVADDGTRIGTELDGDWLRHRIWELTKRKLTVAASEHLLDSCRVLVLTVPEALELVEHAGRVRWRVGSNCVEVDPVVWRAGMLQRIGFDWSAQPSGHTFADVRPTALEIAREYLTGVDSGERSELASTGDQDLLTRLDLLDSEGWLNNAGSLLFVGTPFVGIDYMRRDVPGGDSIFRIEETTPLVQQVREAERAGKVANRTTHVFDGFAQRQITAIPPRAFREAIVNGIAHRDWASPNPTTVEHVGNTLTVASPGGFIGGVTPENAITHPAVPRYRCLAQALASLGLAERQGIGIDRMVRDMLAIGRPAPVISEIEGPYVSVTLLGGEPDTAIVDLVSLLEPREAVNVETLLLIEQLSHRGWIDADRAAPTLQRPVEAVSEAIRLLSEATVGGEAVITKVRGTPAHIQPAYHFAPATRNRLAHRLAPLMTPGGRDSLIVDWAQARGRVSTTELADLADISVGTANRCLTALEQIGILDPGRVSKGRGFFYTPSAPP